MALREFPLFLGTQLYLEPSTTTAALTAWAQAGVLKAQFVIDTGAFPSPTGGVELALFTADPGRAGSQASEIVGTGYAALTILPADWIDPTPFDDGNGGYSQVENLKSLSWTIGGSGWGLSPVVAIGIRVPAGNLIWYTLLENPVPVDTPGRAILIPARALKPRISGQLKVPGEASAVLQHCFGKGSTPLSRPDSGVWVTHVTSDPGYAGTLSGKEVTGTGYARQLVLGTGWEVVDTGTVVEARLQAGVSATFLSASGGWSSPWTHAVVCRSSVGENALLYAQYPAPVVAPPAGEANRLTGSNLRLRLS